MSFDSEASEDPSPSAPAPFVHLHNHTEYSLHDGAATVEELVGEALRLGFPALALTDHGNLYGAHLFFEKALAAGIKPILGCEIYIHLDAPPELSPEDGEPFNLYHFPLLVRNGAGYRNLCRILASARVLRGTGVPSVPIEVIRSNADGLIALSGCLRGHLPRLLLADRIKEAVAAAGLYKEIFGKENFYLELQTHGKPEERLYGPALLDLAGKTGLPVVATNDSHFARRTDFARHEMLLAIHQDRTLRSLRESNHYTQSYYLRSWPEMSRLFSRTPSALRATVEIAERCNFRLDDLTSRRPRLPCVAGRGEDAVLYELATSRLLAIGRSGAGYSVRLDAEIELITGAHLSGYFLMLWDLAAHARSRNVPISAGHGFFRSSLVAYCLGITELDPVENGLVFEAAEAAQRPTHLSVDVSGALRNDLEEHIFSTYGTGHVAHIAEVGPLPPRVVLRDCARAMELPEATSESLVASIRPETSIRRSMRYLLAAAGNPDAPDLLRLAAGIENLAHHVGVHGTSLVLSAEPVQEVLPAHRAAGDRLVVHFSAQELDRLGFLRFEFPGNNRALHIMSLAGRELPERTDDTAAFALLERNEVVGIYPLDNPHIQSLGLAPHSFEELVTLIALGRLRNAERSGTIAGWILTGRRAPDDLRELEPEIGSTGGALLFEEQLAAILSRHTDGSVRQAEILKGAEAGELRSALAWLREKRSPAAREDGEPSPSDLKMSRLLGRLKKSLRRRGLSRKLAPLVLLIDESAADLASRAAAATLALQTYRLAYLKARFPLDFMAAKLTNRAEEDEDLETLLKECRRMSIRLLPADINLSQMRCTIEYDAIRLGLVTVGQLGMHAAEEVLRVRGAGFRNFSDFLFAFDHRKLNHPALDALVSAGCFDSFGLDRGALSAAVPQFLSLKQSRERIEGQGDLFESEQRDAAMLEAQLRAESARIGRSSGSAAPSPGGEP